MGKKIRITITLDKETLNRFKNFCKENDMKISTKINSLIKEWLENKK